MYFQVPTVNAPASTNKVLIFNYQELFENRSELITTKFLPLAPIKSDAFFSGTPGRNLASCQGNERIVNSVFVSVFEGIPFLHHEAGHRTSLSNFVLSMNMKC